MKLFAALVLSAAVLCCGCARRYTITTNSGSQIGTRGKPRLQNGVYLYKDMQGEPQRMPAGRVREIAPSSMVTGPSDRYPGSK